MNIVLRNPLVFDWRIAVCVALAHAAFFLSTLLSFDLFRPEHPLEIAIEISGASSVVTGAKEATQAQQAATPTPTPPKKEAVPDKKQVKTLEKEGELSAARPSAPTASPASSAPSAQVAQASTQAGGMEAAQTRPDVAAKVTKNPKPIYPKKAFEDREEGTVLLHVEVLESGRTGRIQLAKTSGVSSLDVSAIEAVKMWQFVPAKAGGQVVRQWVQIPIKFSLAR